MGEIFIEQPIQPEFPKPSQDYTLILSFSDLIVATETTYDSIPKDHFTSQLAWQFSEQIDAPFFTKPTDSDVKNGAIPPVLRAYAPYYIGSVVEDVESNRYGKPVEPVDIAIHLAQMGTDTLRALEKSHDHDGYSYRLLSLLKKGEFCSSGLQQLEEFAMAIEANQIYASTIRRLSARVHAHPEADSYRSATREKVEPFTKAILMEENDYGEIEEKGKLPEHYREHPQNSETLAFDDIPLDLRRGLKLMCLLPKAVAAPAQRKALEEMSKWRNEIQREIIKYR